MYAKSCTDILYTHRKGLKWSTKHLIGVFILEGIIGEYFFSTLHTVMFEDFVMSVKYTSTNFKAFF